MRGSPAGKVDPRKKKSGCPLLVAFSGLKSRYLTGSSRHFWPAFGVWTQSTASDCGTVLQVNPPSTLQASEQPSPFLLLPSSQSSPVSTLPFPQTILQAVVAPLAARPGTRHCHPDSTVLQSAEQPSPELLLPSSQTSGDVTMPSLHLALRTQAWPMFWQSQPFSI